jgi:hyperosmotically inducible periplasmic protein
MNIDRYRSTLLTVSVIAALGVGAAACERKSETAYDRDSDASRSAEVADQAIAGTSMAAERTGQAASDTWITTKVKSELLADSVAKGFDVSVKTTNGVVALEGTLKDQYAIDHVTQIAAGVERVVSVDASGLTVEP